MPNTKEKLIELLNDCQAKGFWSYGTDCKTGEHGGHDMTAEDIADYLIENIASKWISVKDRLPERGQTVLVCGSRKGIYTAEFRMDGKYYYFHKLNSKTHWCEPTHWMPLPEPPKGE